MLVDANILLYSVDEANPFQPAASRWMVDHLNGSQRVGIPWQSIHAFMRIVTNPRASATPLSAREAWEIADGWLEAPATWTPAPGRAHRRILSDLLIKHDIRAQLVPDAVLAAICVEHGLTIVSADSDFARFPEIEWINPVAP